MCYLELLTGIRAETAIIPLSLTCHYCLFSAASLSASGEAQSRACTSERAPAHTCSHTKLFLTVSLFQGKRLLSCATCGSGPSPPHPTPLKRFHLCLPLSVSVSPAARCSVVIVSFFYCCTFREKCTAQHKKKKNKTTWHMWPFLIFLRNNCGGGEKNNVHLNKGNHSCRLTGFGVEVQDFFISSGETNTVKRSRTQKKRNILTQV